MTLFLVQHGKSLTKDIDPEQGLSSEGVSDVTRIAEVARGYQIHVDSIRHSGKKRAQETAEILASFLKPEFGVYAVEGLKPLDDVSKIVPALNTDENTMFVGHLPFMQRLLSLLIIKNADIPIFAFQNGGIVALEQHSDTKNWLIKWTLMPKIEND